MRLDFDWKPASSGASCGMSKYLGMPGFAPRPPRPRRRLCLLMKKYGGEVSFVFKS